MCSRKKVANHWVVDWSALNSCTQSCRTEGQVEAEIQLVLQLLGPSAGCVQIRKKKKKVTYGLSHRVS